MPNESMRTATGILLDERGANRLVYRLGTEPENSGEPSNGGQDYWRTVAINGSLQGSSVIQGGDQNWSILRRPGRQVG